VCATEAAALAVRSAFSLTFRRQMRIFGFKYLRFAHDFIEKWQVAAR
jgi:hypothetical protein